ncbi:MAG TPA: class I SAM-dependent methyltransferase [Cyclobacteriaceae bacterium]|nr:class I SAM-dependent methyltransferase [Cyclobacteriaceae bacterium]
MILEEVNSCPICQGNQFTTLHTSKDYTSSAELFTVKQCTGCSLVLTSPRPVESQASLYYQSSNYISHQAKAASFLDRIYHAARYFTLKWKYNLIRPYAQGSLLDVGCGTGAFLTYCQNKGIHVTGIEPSDARLSITGITTYKTLNEIPAQPFTVITLWHVLEHMYPLRESIQQLSNNLAHNGTIFIAVPNRLSLDAKTYDNNWAAWDVPRHIWHFSEDNMKDLMQRCGLQVKEITPMKLDAFYVALLSERYLGTSKIPAFQIIRALYQGLRSNLSARRTGQYSSLIYRITR